MLGSLWESSPEDFEILKLGNTTFIWFFFLLEIEGFKPPWFRRPRRLCHFFLFQRRIFKADFISTSVELCCCENT